MIDKLSIITLDTNKRYAVVETLTYQDHDYLFLTRVDENEELLDENIFVEKVKTNKGYGVKPIEDEEIIKLISKKFLDSI